MKPKYTRKQLVEIVNSIHALQITPIIRNMIVKDLLATKPKSKSKKVKHFVCNCNGMKHWCTSKCPNTNHPQPQLKDIEQFDLKDGWASSISKRTLADKLNRVIDRVNLLSKLVNEK